MCVNCVASRRICLEVRMRKKQTLSLRVSSEFKKRLVAEAKKQKRSVTNYIEVTLEMLWDERKSDLSRRVK